MLGSRPMIRNYDISNIPSKRINIELCTWETLSDLSNINYLYFFVDKQGYTTDTKIQTSKLTISGCTRDPVLHGISNAGALRVLPNINVYSNRYPLQGTNRGGAAFQTMSKQQHKEILYTNDFFMGNWYLAKSPGSAIDTILKFKSYEPGEDVLYGLNRNYTGYNREGLELHYTQNLDTKKITYNPSDIGFLCVNNTTGDFKGFDYNKCSPPNAELKTQVSLGWRPFCGGRCAIPPKPTPPPPKPSPPPPKPSPKPVCTSTCKPNGCRIGQYGCCNDNECDATIPDPMTKAKALCCKKATQKPYPKDCPDGQQDGVPGTLKCSLPPEGGVGACRCKH